MSNAVLVEWPDSSLIKVVESPHLPYVKTYRVATDFSSLADAQQYIADTLYRKTSGDDLSAGDWTTTGDGLNYPGDTHAHHSGYNTPTPVTNLPTQEQANAVAAQAKADEGFETVHYQDGSSAYGVAPLPRTNEHGSPAV